jgi:hypothetical protein
MKVYARRTARVGVVAVGAVDMSATLVADVVDGGQDPIAAPRCSMRMRRLASNDSTFASDLVEELP